MVVEGVKYFGITVFGKRIEGVKYFGITVWSYEVKKCVRSRVYTKVFGTFRVYTCLTT